MRVLGYSAPAQASSMTAMSSYVIGSVLWSGQMLRLVSRYVLKIVCLWLNSSSTALGLEPVILNTDWVFTIGMSDGSAAWT